MPSSILSLYQQLFGRKGPSIGADIDMAEHGRVGGLSTGQPFKFTVPIDPDTGDTLTPTPAITGFATSVKQDTGNTSLSSIDTKIDALTTPSDTQPVSAASLPLPTGASTSAAQTTGNSSLANIETYTNNIPALTSGFFGQAKIAVTGTAVQLGSNTLENGVIITALSTNTGIIKIGGSGVTNVSDGTGNGYLLEAGGSVSVAVTNTNVLYINGTANDIISMMAC